MIVRATARRLADRTTIVVDLFLGIAAAIATVVAMAIGFPVLVLGVVLACVMLAVVRPHAGLATLAILLPLRPPDVLNPPGPILLLIAGLALGCLLRLPFDDRRPRIGAGLWFLGAYLLLSAIAVPVALSGGLASEQADVAYLFVQLAGLGATFVIARYLLESTTVTPYVLLLLGSVAFAAGLGILQWVWGSPAGIPLREIMSPAPDAEWTDRVRGPLYNTNYFGFMLATAIVLAAATMGRVRLGGKLLILGLSGVISIALVLTFSRGAILTLLAGLLALAWFRSRRLAVSLAVTAALVVAVAYPIFLAARVGGSGGDVQSGLASDDQNVALRESILATGVQMFLTQPIFGVGFGRFQFESPDFQGSYLVTYPHNTYTQILAEQGLVGGVAAFACVAALALALRRARGPYRASGTALLVTVLAAGMTLEVTSSMQASGLVVFALAGMLAASAAERMRSPVTIAVGPASLPAERARQPSLRRVPEGA